MTVSRMLYGQAGPYKLASNEFVSHHSQKSKSDFFVTMSAVSLNDGGGGFDRGAVSWLGGGLPVHER